MSVVRTPKDGRQLDGLDISGSCRDGGKVARGGRLCFGGDLARAPCLGPMGRWEENLLLFESSETSGVWKMSLRQRCKATLELILIYTSQSENPSQESNLDKTDQNTRIFQLRVPSTHPS